MKGTLGSKGPVPASAPGAGGRRSPAASLQGSCCSRCLAALLLACVQCLLPVSYPRCVIVGMLHTLIKALEVKEPSPGWICSFISLQKPAGHAAGTRWERPPRACCRVLELMERELVGARVSGRSKAPILAPSSHPCIPGHAPAGDVLYQHRQLIHAQFKSLFAFKNSSVTPLLSRPVATERRVAGSWRWRAAWV